jgi:hypothetical protein
MGCEMKGCELHHKSKPLTVTKKSNGATQIKKKSYLFSIIIC